MRKWVSGYTDDKAAYIWTASYDYKANHPMHADKHSETSLYIFTSSFVMLDSLAADQAFEIIKTKAESSWFFSAKLSIFLQAASKEGELIISCNFNSAAFNASALSVALS